MFLRLVAGLMLCLISAGAHAEIDCRIRAMPPAKFSSGALPGVKYKGLPLAELQSLYRQLAGLPKRPLGRNYCGDPIGFVDPRGVNMTIYYPNNVSSRCRREVIAHEEAHVRGWANNHPGARIQSGPCRGKG